MESLQFVEIIKEVVINDSVRSIQANLIKVAGRTPDEKLKLLSDYYNKLNDGEKSMILKIVTEAVETSIFGFLCVLDGVRAIEEKNKGELKLYYEREDLKILINDQNKIMLHELL